MTDVTNINLRCYTSETNATAETAAVTAGSTVGFRVDPIIGHFGVRCYLVGQCRCDLTTTVASDDLYGQGAVYGERLGSVWFRVVQGKPTTAPRETTDTQLMHQRKIYEVPPTFPDGVITWPSQNLTTVTCACLTTCADFLSKLLV